ncbi:MAG: phage tail tube protein, partial [Syntrophobacteraceae bacterium]
MLTRKSVVLAKIEANYGVDPTPTPIANALLVSDVDVKPAGEMVQRNYMKSSLSQLPFVRGIRSVDVSFKTELKGTGTRGVLPAYGWEGVLFRACGMSEVVNAATSIIWAPVSTALESVTLYVYKDGVFHKILGCVGSFKLLVEVGKYVVVEWTFRGLYAAPVDATPAAQTFSAVQPPVVLNAGFTLGAYAAILEKVEIDINNAIGMRRSMNASTGVLGFSVVGREPQGSCDPEAVTEATYAFWNKRETAAVAAMNIGPLGATSGNIITIAAPKVQEREVGYGDRE